MAVTQLGAGWEGAGEIVQLVVTRRWAGKMLVLLIPSQGRFWLSSNTEGTLAVPQPGTMGIGSPCSRSRSGCGREGWSQLGASVGGLSLSFAYHKVAHIRNISFLSSAKQTELFEWWLASHQVSYCSLFSSFGELDDFASWGVGGKGKQPPGEIQSKRGGQLL